ncbi:hypothetical protein V5799_003642 [Amblyomma americanum]|uniref:Vesicular amine transporter n=1 Tax=Amblyomma americanum TaxID=6943 RepID=A0AAQ4D8D4_AMBAM
MYSHRSLWAKLKARAWLLPVIYTQFWAAAVISLVAPFFPPLADSRGIPAWEYGFFFSTMKLMMLPGAVIAEKLISNVSARAGYLGGQISTALFSILCGRTMTNTTTLFFFVFFLVACHCVHGVMECLWGAGTLVGSSLGGALIDLWAFPLPFFVIGGLLVLSLPLMASINPKSSKHGNLTIQTACQPLGPEKKYSHLLYDFVFVANLITVTLSWSMTGFNEPTLEPFLRQFKLSNTEVGAVFTVQFVGYSIGALLSGVFAKFKMEPFMNFFGMLLSVVGYSIVGPISIIPIEPNLFFVYISQVFMGIALSVTYVSPYMHAIRYVVESAGYPDNEKTHGVVTSATYQFMVVGAVVTSPLAGLTTQKLGFRFSSMIFTAFLAFWTIVTAVVWLHLDYSLFGKARRPSEVEPSASEDEGKAQMPSSS